MIKKTFGLVLVASITFVTLLYPSSPPIAYSQGETEVKCGQIIENEFTDNAQEHTYVLAMSPRESFDVLSEAFGDFLKTVITIYGPSGIRIGITNADDDGNYDSATGSKSSVITSGILSARGTYKISVTNTAKSVSLDKLGTDPQWFGGVGLYTLSIGCTTSDGKKIEPGDIPQPTPTPAPLPSPTEQISSQTSLAQQPVSETLFSFLETGQMYEITFGLQTETIKLIELRSDGWAKVEVDSRTGWLNINQVALIIPIN